MRANSPTQSQNNRSQVQSPPTSPPKRSNSSKKLSPSKSKKKLPPLAVSDSKSSPNGVDNGGKMVPFY